MSCRLLSWERINNSGARPHFVFHPLAWQCLLTATLVTFRGGCILLAARGREREGVTGLCACCVLLHGAHHIAV